MKDHDMTPFQWDYPTQGLRFPRTTAEAFGPYAMDPLPPRRSRRKTARNYAIAALLLIATAALFV